MKEKTYTKTNGQIITYLHGGDENKPALMFLHGITARAEFFNDIFCYFENDYNIFAPDFAGHGNSYRRIDYYFLEDFLQDTMEFIRNVVKNKLYIIGYSMGGRVGMAITGENKDICKKFVIVDVAPDIDPIGLDMLIKTHLETPEYFDSYNELENYLRTKRGIKDDKVIKKQLNFYWKKNEQGKITTIYDKKVWDVSLEKIGRDCEFLNKAVKNIDIPVLIIRGGDSPVLNKDDALKLKNNLKNAKLIEIPDTTHAVITEKADMCADCIKNFFNG